MNNKVEVSTGVGTVLDALDYAKQAHDKPGPDGGKATYGNLPYIVHPLLAVLARLYRGGVIIPQQLAVDALHDTVEDTDETPDSLRGHGFTPAIIGGVAAVTSEKDASRHEKTSKAKNDPLGEGAKLDDAVINLLANKGEMLPHTGSIGDAVVYSRTVEELLSGQVRRPEENLTYLERRGEPAEPLTGAEVRFLIEEVEKRIQREVYVLPPEERKWIVGSLAVGGRLRHLLSRDPELIIFH